MHSQTAPIKHVQLLNLQLLWPASMAADQGLSFSEVRFTNVIGHLFLLIISNIVKYYFREQISLIEYVSACIF